MKVKSLQKAFSLLSIGLLSTIGVSAQSWTTVGTAGFAASGQGVANWQKLRIDKYNTPYLSYNDEGFGLNNSMGTIMKFDGTDWVSVGTPGFTAGFAHHSDFVFGGGDTLYFSYANGTSTNMSRAAVMMYDGTTWSSIGTDLTAGAAQYTSLAYASDGTLYLGMIDISTNAMVVKKYNGGTSWTDVGSTPPGGSTASAAYADMTLDNFDTLYVAYRDNNEAPGKVRVQKFDGTNWQNVGTPLLATTGAGAGPAMDIYIAFDEINRPHVSYSHTFMGPPRISVERFNGTTWELLGPAQFSSGQFETSLFSSLALPKEAPYVAYQHGGLGLKTAVKKFNLITQTWDDVGTPGVSDGVAAHTSIAVDGNGNLYVAYYDDMQGGKTTVKKYTVCEAPVLNQLTAVDTPLCNNAATLSVTGTLNDATNWQWYTGACNNGTLIGVGASIQVTPDAPTTYYVKGGGSCVSTGPCFSVTVNIAMAQPNITLAGNVFTSSAASGNQWHRNGNPISGATSNTYTATEAGWYYSLVTEGSCSRPSDSLFYEPVSVGNIAAADGIKVYPVPFSNSIKIDINNASTDWHAVVTDYLGRTILQTKLAKGVNDLNMTKQPAGLYFIKVFGNNKEYIFKSVKE